VEWAVPSKASRTDTPVCTGAPSHEPMTEPDGRPHVLDPARTARLMYEYRE